VIKQFLKKRFALPQSVKRWTQLGLLEVIKMEKVMATGFLLLFCVAFLVIKESSGGLVCIPGSRLPVSAVINFTALSCFYKVIHAFSSFLVFDISRAWP